MTETALLAALEALTDQPARPSEGVEGGPAHDAGWRDRAGRTP